MALKTYTELIALPSFDERLRYLMIHGSVGKDTFGFDRYLNQTFYKSKEWKQLRDYVIVRDSGNDLAVDGFTIHDKILVHHMNPIDQTDITNRSDFLLNPEYLICVSHDTHNQIHYGFKAPDILPIVRRKGDTTLWNT